MILALTNATLACPVGGVTKGNLLVRDGHIVATGIVDIPAEAEILFNTDCGKRASAAALSIGLDLRMLSHQAGHA